MHVTELASASWSDILEASLTTAEESGGPEDWQNFWHNIAYAPQEARQEYIDELELERIKFRAVSGKWTSRSLLIVQETSSGLPEDHVMDPQFRRQIETTVPPHWLSEFPSASEILQNNDSFLIDYRRWLSPVFDEICKKHSGSTPRKLPNFSSSSIRMPAGWRLLPVLPSAASARLTEQLLNEIRDLPDDASSVTIVHPTRQEAYPEVTVPHPVYYWLNLHGKLRVGRGAMELRLVPADLAETLGKAGILMFDAVDSRYHLLRSSSLLVHFLPALVKEQRPMKTGSRTCTLRSTTGTATHSLAGRSSSAINRSR